MINTLVCESWNARHFHKNNFGVRDNIDYSYTRTPGRTRVTFVGDSATAGNGVKDVEDRFVNRIRRLHPEWEVHAIAIPGLDTSTEVDKMHNLTVSNHYQLDQVVLVYHLNDIGELMTRWVEGYKKMIADPIWKSWPCRNSYFFNLYYHWWQLSNNAYMQHYFDETEDAYKGPLWDYEKIGLLAFRNMTRIRGGRLLVVTIPHLDAMERFRFANEKLNQYWQQNSVPHMDLLDVFSNVPPDRLVVNSHDAHPNEYAHALAAPAIDAFLRRHITNSPAVDAAAR
jgi:lysophospholipase L1-like esterase